MDRKPHINFDDLEKRVNEVVQIAKRQQRESATTPGISWEVRRELEERCMAIAEAECARREEEWDLEEDIEQTYRIFEKGYLQIGTQLTVEQFNTFTEDMRRTRLAEDKKDFVKKHLTLYERTLGPVVDYIRDLGIITRKNEAFMTTKQQILADLFPATREQTGKNIVAKAPHHDSPERIAGHTIQKSGDANSLSVAVGLFVGAAAGVYAILPVIQDEPLYGLVGALCGMVAGATVLPPYAAPFINRWAAKNTPGLVYNPKKKALEEAFEKKVRRHINRYFAHIQSGVRQQYALQEKQEQDILLA